MVAFLEIKISALVRFAAYPTVYSIQGQSQSLLATDKFLPLYQFPNVVYEFVCRRHRESFRDVHRHHW